jgi:hypothetical protein
MERTMTDRELLELAAKAAGVHLHHWFKGHETFMAASVDGGDPDYSWNPLTDDGDALRLAASLRLDISHTSDMPFGPERVGVLGMTEPYSNGDPLPAIRRAIVKAAAEIGKRPNTGAQQPPLPDA